MYLIRVNGQTSHNNPHCKDCFVPGEPPIYPKTTFRYFRKCLDENFVRLGWPGVGDLNTKDGKGALPNCYDWKSLRQYIRDYLDGFFHIPVGSTVLMPNIAQPGELAIGITISRTIFITLQMSRMNALTALMLIGTSIHGVIMSFTRQTSLASTYTPEHCGDAHSVTSETSA